MIQDINSIPIFIDHNNFIEQNDIDNLKKLEYHFLPEVGNSFTTNLDVLKQFPNIEKMFIDKMKEYEEEVIGGLSPAELYITQSWISDTNKEGHHVGHNHDNSLFSAILYISVPDNGCINFLHKNRLFEAFNFLTPFQKETPYNRTITKLYVKDGDFVIFPSWLMHSVDINNSDKNRMVLAANFFIRGSIGYDRYPMRLELK